MFLGEFNHASDAKGRFFIPAKYREELGTTFVITQSIDKCLCAYPMSVWEKYAEKIEALPDVTARKVKRYVFSKATDAELDSQGRVLISQSLRDYAGIEKGANVVILGIGSYFEIWSENEHNKELELESPEEIADMMTALEQIK